MYRIFGIHDKKHQKKMLKKPPTFWQIYSARSLSRFQVLPITHYTPINPSVSRVNWAPPGCQRRQRGTIKRHVRKGTCKSHSIHRNGIFYLHKWLIFMVHVDILHGSHENETKIFFRYTIDTSTGKCTLQAAQEVKDVWAVACKKLHVDHIHRACGENMLLSKVSWENPWVEYVVVVKN